MSRFSSRPYAGASDLPLLINFARTATLSRGDGPTTWHPGDIVWQLYDYRGEGDFAHVWFDGDTPVALAIFEPPVTASFDLAPGYAEEDLAEEVVAWAESRRRAFPSPAADGLPIALASVGSTNLGIASFEADTARTTLLGALGYRRIEHHSVSFACDVTRLLEPPPLPAGMRLRHVKDDELEERVDLHRDAWSVWGPSRARVNAYRRLRASPLYDAEFDVVLEGTDGRLLSYCICWPDDESATGNFEPVGTRPEFAGRGLARLVLHEAMRRMRDRGLQTAYVSTASVNASALRLYPACGFRETGRAFTWVKEM